MLPLLLIISALFLLSIATLYATFETILLLGKTGESITYRQMLPQLLLLLLTLLLLLLVFDLLPYLVLSEKKSCSANNITCEKVFSNFALDNSKNDAILVDMGVETHQQAAVATVNGGELPNNFYCNSFFGLAGRSIDRHGLLRVSNPVSPLFVSARGKADAERVNFNRLNNKEVAMEKLRKLGQVAYPAELYARFSPSVKKQIFNNPIGAIIVAASAVDNRNEIIDFVADLPVGSDAKNQIETALTIAFCETGKSPVRW